MSDWHKRLDIIAAWAARGLVVYLLLTRPMTVELALLTLLTFFMFGRIMNEHSAIVPPKKSGE